MSAGDPGVNPGGPDAGRDHGYGASMPGGRALRGARRRDDAGLARLEARVRHDLECLNHPPPDWVPALRTAQGEEVLDVLVAGAGMCGQTAAFGLLREGVRDVRIVDRSDPGNEGPWNTFARMETLRSPKHLTGPDLGIPSLTFRAWYEASYGAQGWDELYKVWRLDWLEYLLWVRRVVGLPVENRTALRGLEPRDDGLLAATLDTPDGPQRVVVRKVVLALGREGSGAPRWPRFASFDPRRIPPGVPVFHSADAIDFDALRGRSVAVLGVGASAFDNAGLALESGARAVTMYARRPHLPQVNKAKWASFPGFFRGYASLDDSQRWVLSTYLFDEQVPPPFESVLRCERHPGFELRLGEGWDDLIADCGGVTVRTAAGERRFDAAVVATGFDVDLFERPELEAFRGRVLTWADRLSGEQARAHPEAARFPYLGDGFQMLARDPGLAPAAANVHLFNWGSALSLGALAGDIPGLAFGVSRLAGAIARDLFLAESDRLHGQLLAHAEPELGATRYHVG